MREAENLGSGFWFPTPTRVVEIGQFDLLISSSPTVELKRHFPSVERAGYARLISNTDSKPVGRQAFASWLGSVPDSTPEWAAQEIESIRPSLGPTIQSAGLEFFNVGRHRRKAVEVLSPAWTSEIGEALVYLDDLVLCREPLSPRTFRYFVGQVGNGRLLAESDRLAEPYRLQFGLAALTRRRLVIAVEKVGSSDVFFTPRDLPLPERRLLLALGRRDMGLPGRAFLVRLGEQSAMVWERLEALGADVRRSNDND